MRALVTGASGFAGTHLSQFLLSRKNIEVYGLVRSGSKRAPVPGVRALRADLLNRASVEVALRKIKPHRIFHLAGQASVALSWKEPAKTLAVNVEGTRNLLEAALRLKLSAKIHVACSAEEYGVSGDLRGKLLETSALKPVNPYAVSKIAQDFLALQYHLSHRMPIVRTRAFNHIGPGQNERFVAPDFARQLALIEEGRRKPEIEVGNLDAVRDFTDVRDVARGYWMALEKGVPGEVYNIASGRPRRVAEILQYYLGASSVRIRVFHAQGRKREAEVGRQVGDARKIRRDTGWRPRIGFEATLKDILNEWRQKIHETR